MKQLSTLIFSVCITGAFAQNSIEPGSVWKVQELETMSGFNQIDTTIHCAEYSITDSVFEYGRWYYPLYSSGYHNGQVFTNDTVALLRVEGQRMVARSTSNRFGSGFDTTEFVLYDYSLQVGDTIPLKFQGNRYFNNRETIETYRVINRDSIQTVSGKHLRLSLVFERINPANFPISNYHNTKMCGVDTVMEWIEGIGTREGFYYPINGSDCQGFYPDYFIQSLVCFEIDSIAQFIPIPDCDCVQLQSLNEQEVAQVEVYPRPVGNLLYITVPRQWVSADAHIELLTLQGQLVLETSLNHHVNTLDMEDCCVPGMYLLIVRSAGEIAYSTTISKQ